jgi:uncharacterized protein (DUF433 family)
MEFKFWWRRESHVKNEELLERVTFNPEIFGGKPLVRGMRISVESVLSLLAQGVPEREILDDYPDLEPADIRACIAYDGMEVGR